MWKMIAVAGVSVVLGVATGPMMYSFVPSAPPWAGWILSAMSTIIALLFDVLLFIAFDYPGRRKLHDAIHGEVDGERRNLLYETYRAIADHVLPQTALISPNHACPLHQDPNDLSELHDRMGVVCAAINLGIELDTVRKLGSTIVGITRQQEEIIDRIRELAHGTYTVWSRHKIYEEDIYLLSKLRGDKGHSFRCTVCLENDPASQFALPAYEHFITAQLEAAKQGVRIERLYILRTESDHNDPAVAKHFEDLANRSSSLQLPNGIFRILFIVLEPLSWRFEQKEFYESLDLVIINDTRISQGKIDPHIGIVQALFTSQPPLVTEAVRHWDTLFRHATQYEAPARPRLLAKP